eukprot:TRINITY_DN1031_c0_g1_i8.p1 TRINITY_DN1031_c0_g1~~TRINITY_DN1031_c0_g1_i8.p1  ORF type:complete len:222 (+),score=-19.94 TRINITY_DN1031_c0_g1_i8:638-1303(+)
MHNLIIIVVLILYCDEFEKNVQSQVIQSEKYFKGYCTTLKIQYNYILCLYISIYILHMGQWYLMQALIQNHRQMIIFSYKYQIASLNTKKRIVTRNVKQNFQKLKTLPALNKYSLLLTIQISISKLSYDKLHSTEYQVIFPAQKIHFYKKQAGYKKSQNYQNSNFFRQPTNFKIKSALLYLGTCTTRKLQPLQKTYFYMDEKQGSSTKSTIFQQRYTSNYK